MPRVRLSDADKGALSLNDEERAICFRISRSRDGVIVRMEVKGQGADYWYSTGENGSISYERAPTCEAMLERGAFVQIAGPYNRRTSFSLHRDAKALVV